MYIYIPRMSYVQVVRRLVQAVFPIYLCTRDHTTRSTLVKCTRRRRARARDRSKVGLQRSSSLFSSSFSLSLDCVEHALFFGRARSVVGRAIVDYSLSVADESFLLFPFPPPPAPFVRWLVGSVGWLVGRSVGRSVGRLETALKITDDRCSVDRVEHAPSQGKIGGTTEFFDERARYARTGSDNLRSERAASLVIPLITDSPILPRSLRFPEQRDNAMMTRRRGRGRGRRR